MSNRRLSPKISKKKKEKIIEVEDNSNNMKFT